MGSSASCKNHPYSFDVDPVNYPNTNKYNFQFTYKTETDRNNIAKFMDWIPKGSYVMVRLFVVTPFTSVPLVDVWKGDVTGNASLYSKFIEQGLSGIESFTAAQPGVFIYKKDDDSFVPVQDMGGNVNAQFNFTQNLPSKDTVGYIKSPKFGPAKAWKSVQWNGRSEESCQHR